MISVIISTYKRPAYLERAIQSVINQTFEDWELIVVDDDPKGKPPTIFEGTPVDQFRYIKSEKNHGNDTKPKNMGILASKGEYIAFLDDDNEYRPDHLQALYSAIKDTSLDVVYGDRWVVDEDKKQKEGIGKYYDYNLSHLFEENYIDTSDVLIRRESLFKVGGFDERYTKYVDWNLWLRMGKSGMRFKRVPLVLTNYHLHSNMKSIRKQTEGDKKFKTNTPEWDPYELIVRQGFLGEMKPPRVAVFTLTYDRLELTKKTLANLTEKADYPFDHFIVDNGSKDGTVEWLKTNYKYHWLMENETNLGISKASNQAVEAILTEGGYDIIVKIDNDITFDNKGFLKKMVEIWESNNLVALSCYPQGLRDNPGGSQRLGYGKIRGQLIGMTRHLGGACHFVDARAYKDFKWDENDFLHGIQDVEFSRYLLINGFQMGYLENYYMQVNTAQIEKEYPAYFERRKTEKTTRNPQ